MSSFNQVTLVGNVGNDPELRSLASGGRVATLSLATSEKWTDAAGAKQEKTAWHRVVVWNSQFRPLADLIERYVKKGDKLLIQGKIEYKQWQDKDGQTRYSTEINAQLVTFLSNKAKGAATAPAAARGTNDFPNFPDGEDDDELPF